MSRSLSELIESFVLPLLGGGDVAVAGPIRPREHAAMAQQAGELGHPQLRFLRLRRAMQLVPVPELPDPDLDELALWVGLHNTLAFDHPERERVWARAVTWRRAESMTRGLLTMGMPTDAREALARHVSIGALLELERVDTVVPTPGQGEVKFRGQAVGRRRLLGAGAGGQPKTSRVRWWAQSHAPDTERLLADVLWTSPLTCLLHPLLAPAGWSPLASGPGFLEQRAYARLVCHTWASEREWIAVGGRVTRGLLDALQVREQPTAVAVGAAVAALPGVGPRDDAAAVAEVVGALVHLHFLKVLELDARLGVALGSRDPGILAFLALPLLLPLLEPVIGSPIVGLDGGGLEAQVGQRWAEYVDHLEELVSRELVENLVETVVPRVVQR